MLYAEDARYMDRHDEANSRFLCYYANVPQNIVKDLNIMETVKIWLTSCTTVI